MKNSLFLLLLLCCMSIGNAQANKNWLISIDFGIQEHDKRLYHWAEFSARRLLDRQPETFGTYQVGISISKKVVDHKKFSVYAGVGLSVELATFLRPFNHLYNEDRGPYVLRFTDRYYKYIVQFPIQSKYQFSERWSVTLSALPQFSFLTIADNTAWTKESLDYSWREFNLYSIELAPGIEYNIGRLNFGMRYRALQLKIIDPILFYSTGVYTMSDEKYETYNPFKLWFSAGYEIW